MVYNEKAEKTGAILKVLLKGSLGMAPRDRGAADQKRNTRTGRTTLCPRLPIPLQFNDQLISFQGSIIIFSSVF